VYEELKREIAKAFKYIEKKGWNYGRAGNISVFIREKKHVLVTPSGAYKAKLKPEDIIVVDVNGGVIEGRDRPTIELPMHLAIYRAYEHINAVVHAHGIYSTALAIARKQLPVIVEEMDLYIGGDVRVADYAPAGTQELAESVVKALKGRKAVLLANHGVIACGGDLEEAVEILGLVERLSQAYILARVLGDVHLLPTSKLDRVRS